MALYQFTTPVIPLHITGIDFEDVDIFRVAIEGPGTQLIKVVSSDAETVDSGTNTLYITLTQEETANLGEGYAYFQVRMLTYSGAVIATNKVVRNIESVIDEVVIVNNG